MLYTILAALSRHELVMEVVFMLQNEWILAGGVSFDGKYYLQAMTKQQ